MRGRAKLLVIAGCACVALVANGAVAARSTTIYLSDIEAHVDTVLEPGFVEGTVTAAPDAPRRCTSGRSVVVVDDKGKALSSGTTEADGTFSIRLKGDAQRARVKQRSWERGRRLTVCEKAETFISFFIPSGASASYAAPNRARSRAFEDRSDRDRLFGLDTHDQLVQSRLSDSAIGRLVEAGFVVRMFRAVDRVIP